MSGSGGEVDLEVLVEWWFPEGGRLLVWRGRGREKGEGRRVGGNLHGCSRGRGNG